MMNKLINRLFEKDLVVKIVSVLTAILIWFVVLDSDNPLESKTISVPLASNIDVLLSNSFQIVGTPLPTSIDVKIRGRRKKLEQINPNDFKVSVDLSNIFESGTRNIKISDPIYTGDKDILITGMNPSSLNLNFERILGKQFPVTVDFTGSLPQGYELVNIRVEPNIVILEEKESSISKVSRIVAYVNLDEAENNKEIVMRATVLDSNGSPIKQFEGKVPVIITYNLAKNVPVVTSTIGALERDLYIKEINNSSVTAKIIGNRSVLDDIKALNANEIDITDKTESYNVPLTFNLPDGVVLAEGELERLYAEIVIERLITTDINLYTSSVSIFPKPEDNALYSVEEGIVSIRVKGKVEDINKIKSSDISLSIQVRDLEPGLHEVPLNVRVPDTVSVVGEYTVNVIVNSVQEEVTDPTMNTPTD